VIEQASRPVVDDPGAVMKGSEISSPHSGMRPRTRGPARWGRAQDGALQRLPPNLHCCHGFRQAPGQIAYGRQSTLRPPGHRRTRRRRTGLHLLGLPGTPRGRARGGARMISRGRSGTDSRMRHVVNRPNVDQQSRDCIEDLGLVADDHTEVPGAPDMEG
jgi:hypothetical protein